MTECHTLGNSSATEVHFGSWPQKLECPKFWEAASGKGLVAVTSYWVIIRRQESRGRKKGGGRGRKTLSWGFVQSSCDRTLDTISCIPRLPHTHYTIRDDLEFRILLPRPPRCWDCRQVHPIPGHPVYVLLGTKPRARQALSAKLHPKPLTTPVKSQLSTLLWRFTFQLMSLNRPIHPWEQLFLCFCCIRMASFGVLSVFLYTQFRLSLRSVIHRVHMHASAFSASAFSASLSAFPISYYIRNPSRVWLNLLLGGLSSPCFQPRVPAVSSTGFYFSFSVPHIFKKTTTSPVIPFNINHLLNFAFAPWDVEKQVYIKAR